MNCDRLMENVKHRLHQKKQKKNKQSEWEAIHYLANYPITSLKSGYD